MENVVIEKVVSGLGKLAADLMKEKIMQSKYVRDLKEKWVKDNYHAKTVEMFKAAVIDAKYAVELPDDLFRDLISDPTNRDVIFRWILEGVQPGHLDKGRLNTEVYMEMYPRDQDRIYPFFESILGRLKHYKITRWSPEFLALLSQLEELKTSSHEGFRWIADKQDRMAAKQEQFQEWMYGRLGDPILQQKYTPEWFADRARENMKNIGERYSEDLNVEVKASQMIDAIEQNEKFRADILEKCSSILASCSSRNRDQEIAEGLNKINEIKKDLASPNGLNGCLPQLAQVITGLKSHLDSNPYMTSSGSLRREVYDFYSEYVGSGLFQIALNPFVMISGGAGVGKSHFIADQVSKRLRAKKVSIFLLGQLFHSEDTILSQIKKQLDIASDEEMEAVFQAFNDYGVEQGERVVIFIDALNEGRGKRHWLNSIGGFVERIRNYSSMALVMSIRDTYENEIIPEGFYENNSVIKVEFKGFDDPDQAIYEFFNYYKVPLNLNDYLKYEFKNPLFLKVYCMAYDRTNASGAESLEGIFHHYFKKINQNLKSRIENYPKHGNLVVEALGCFIDSKLRHKGSEFHFFYETASRDVNQAMAYYGLGVNFFDELIHEKVITVNEITHQGEEQEIVYIAFELFEEFITAKKIVEANRVHTYTNKRDLDHFFSDRNPYAHLLSNLLSNQGIFESLAVQIPDAVFPDYTEEFEMYRWPQHILKYKSIDFKAAYYNSLTWRRPERINGISHSYILNEFLLMSYSRPDEMYDFWDVVLKFTVVKNHFYNADFLFDQLIDLKLDEFNAFWTVYVSERFDQNDSFKRIMKWAWKGHTGRSQLDDESIRLLGMNMAWFTASTCPRVRDVSIKALVKLFTNRIDMLTGILKKFRRVRDAYILEALYCAAYGCVMNTRCMDQVESLASYIYEEFFAGKKVIPHAMIRNYMTGILEFALSKELCRNIQTNDLKPPFTNRYGYYEVKQEEMDELRKEPSESDIESLDPHYAYRSREDLDLDMDMFLYYRKNIIANLEACYTNVLIQRRENINFELAEIVDQILPEYRENFVKMVIKEIFDMGYNFIKFGGFDSYVDHNQNGSLGQKYEWIALNKILSIYLDSKHYICHRFSEDRIKPFEGVWQFSSFRKIDPSIDYFSPFDTRIHEYNAETIRSEDLLNEFSSYAEKHVNQIDWIAVNRIKYQSNDKICRTDPFLLCHSELEAFQRYIQDPGNLKEDSFEDLYVGEIYWSKAYQSLLKEMNQDRLDDEFSDNKIIDTYIWDINDGAMENYIEFSILSPWMLAELKLSIGSRVFELIDEHEELASLQLYDRNYDDILLIRKDKLVRYLTRSDKVIAWPVMQDEQMKMVIFDGLQFRMA